jgi:hypothetical protein
MQRDCRLFGRPRQAVMATFGLPIRDSRVTNRCPTSRGAARSDLCTLVAVPALGPKHDDVHAVHLERKLQRLYEVHAAAGDRRLVLLGRLALS